MTKTIYIAFGCIDEEINYLIGAFDSFEKAEEAAREFEENGMCEEAYIEETDINDMIGKDIT